MEFVEWESVFDVLEVDELADLAIAIAGDIDERAVAFGEFVESMDGHDWEELAERPVIEEALEDGEIADILIAEGGFEFFDFVWEEGHA